MSGNFEYKDMDGSRLTVNPFRGSRVGKQVYVKVTGDGAYIKPDDVADVAAGLLEANGVTPHELDWSNTPETHEAHALAHLQQARVVRTQIAEREAEKARRVIEDPFVLEFLLHIGWTSDPSYKVNSYDRNMYRKAMEFAANKARENATRSGLTDVIVDALSRSEAGVVNSIHSPFDLREEHRGTAWRDIHGMIWEFNEIDLFWERRRPEDSEGTRSPVVDFPWIEVNP
jgi:hypothetical protein